MKYKAFISLPLFALMCTVTSCSGGAVPTFKKTKGVSFTAYAGPTVESWSGASGNPNTLTEENLRKMADGGFNKILALYEGASNARGEDTYDMIVNRSKKAQKDALIALEQCEKVGIKYYVRDWSFYGLVKNYTTGFSPNILTDEQYEIVINKMFDENNQYMHSPAFGGMFAHDEPTYAELERIASQVRIYNQVMKERGIEGTECIVNIYPATVSGVGISSDPNITYEDYVDRTLNMISTQTGYICYDFYPFMYNFYDGSYIKNAYLYNLNLMATKLKEFREQGQEIELRTFLQSVGNWTGMRDPVGIGDFRFQVYCEMAFGSKEFIYYEFANDKPQTGSGFALFDFQQNQFNWTYDLAAKVNNEVHAFEDAYLAYNWDGVMYKNANELYDNQAFSMIEDFALESHPRMKIKSCEQDTFAGTFKNAEGDDAFMVVNYTDPYHNLSDEVKLHFNNARKLLMYRFGQKVVVDLPLSGDYTLKLYPGEGRFIIPIK